MKIAFVSDTVYPYFKGGKENRLYGLSTHLAKLGHEVHIYTMHWWKEPEAVRLENGVYLHAICRKYELYHGDRRSIVEGVAFGAACLKLATIRSDIIDVDQMPFFPVFGTWLVCLLRGKKLYGTWHEALSTREWVKYMGPTGHIAAAIEALSVRLPHTITAASLHTQHLLATRHHRTRRVNVVTPGIDIEIVQHVAPAQAACDVLYVGRLVKDKHVDTLIRAMARVVQKRPSTTCAIIGHGVELQYLTQLIHQLKLEDNVTIIPPLSSATDIYAYMKRARVFVLPSTREGFGMVTLEALACGTPVVTTDSPANASKDLITADKTGSLVALEDAAFAAAILRWVDINKTPLEIANSVKGFDWLSLARTQAEIYLS